MYIVNSFLSYYDNKHSEKNILIATPLLYFKFSITSQIDCISHLKISVQPKKTVYPIFVNFKKIQIYEIPKNFTIE